MSRYVYTSVSTKRVRKTNENERNIIFTKRDRIRREKSKDVDRVLNVKTNRTTKKNKINKTLGPETTKSEQAVKYISGPRKTYEIAIFFNFFRKNNPPTPVSFGRTYTYNIRVYHYYILRPRISSSRRFMSIFRSQ